MQFDPREIKNWWGYNPILKRQEKVDLVAVNYNNSQALICECKWMSAQKLTHEMLTTLQRRADLIVQQINVKVDGLYFFVKETDADFGNEAKKRNIQVVNYEDFFK